MGIFDRRQQPGGGAGSGGGQQFRSVEVPALPQAQQAVPEGGAADAEEDPLAGLDEETVALLTQMLQDQAEQQRYEARQQRKAQKSSPPGHYDLGACVC